MIAAVDYEEAVEIQQLRLGVWKRLWRYTKPYRKDVVLLVLCGVSVALSGIATPLVEGMAIDDVAANGLDARFTLYAVLYFILVASAAIGIWAFIWLAGKIRTHVAHDIRRDGFDTLQRLPFAFFDQRPVGWLMARMTSDCERLSNILAWGVLDLAWGTTKLVAITITMLIINWKLAMAVLVVLPFLFWVSALFRRRILKTAREVRKTNSRITASYNECITGVRTTKTFRREQQNLGEFGGLSTEMYGSSVRNAVLSALYLPIVLTIGSVATAGALVWGGYDVRAGGITIGTLVVFLRYAQQFFEPIQELAHWFAEMQMAQASAERILDLIDTEPAIRDNEAVQQRMAAHVPQPGLAPDGYPNRLGKIEFRDIGFSYDTGGPILESFNLSVEPGTSVALVGATGGGKSTIVNLLCRFYEPTAGGLYLDGVEYRERSLEWLHSQLGVVLQQPHLFSGTLRDNIRYGRLDATDEEVTEAARLAGAVEFIEALKKGFDTQVGEGGVRLSTGQKQLLSFARAILARPQLLIMDEATSSVDTETEAKIQAGVERLLEDRTSFVIAHRLSTIRSADRILVIDRGKIVEQGDHRSLMAQRGRYWRLYTDQSLRDVTKGQGVWRDRRTEIE